jgi:hypothetical protein
VALISRHIVICALSGPNQAIHLPFPRSSDKLAQKI